jgi:HAE1 family hydrophobic/amphiphilic exporter-1
VNFAALFIRRPVFTVMLVALPVVLGLIALRDIGVDLFPNADLPIVTVTTSRPGSSVEEMEIGVTKVIEEAVNTISGLDELRSTTTEGVSVVIAQFLLSKDRDIAQQEVQSKINTILSRLPSGTRTPIIEKFDVDAAPILTIAVTGRRSQRELTEIARKRIADFLSSIDGVGAITVVGGQERAIQVTVDVRKLEAHGVTIEDVRNALAEQNVELPGGRVEQSQRELILRTAGRVPQPEDFLDVIVADRGGYPLRIRDLGPVDAVDDAIEQPRTLARWDGAPAVTLVVQKQSGANSVEVIQRLKARLVDLEAGLAREGLGDVETVVLRDQSRFIEASLREVELHLLFGALLVVVTILLFLRDWRTTVIAGLAIPVSILAVFPVMQALDLTLNNITLLALVLMIGVVVDDAVVVIENVFRWMEEEGKDPWIAALEGTREITLAVVATTLSLFVIFLPIAFMEGVVGRFLYSFGITCAVATIVSLGVSLTLTPMLSARFLRPPKHSAVGKKSTYERIVESPYLAALRWSLRHRGTILVATIAVTSSVFPLPFDRWLSFGIESLATRLEFLRWPGLLAMTGFNFVPKDDQSEFEIAITTPEGWSLGKTSDVFASIEDRVADWPEVETVLSQIGDTSGRQAPGEGPISQGTIYVLLTDLGDRDPDFSQFDVMDRARLMLRDFPDLRTSVQVPAAISQSGTANADVEFQITGPDLERLTEYAEKVIGKLRSLPGLVDVDTTMQARKPELRVVIDRERASDLGVRIEAASATLRTLVGGEIVSDYKDSASGEQYDVWLRAVGHDRDDSRAIASIALRGADDSLVRLENVADADETVGPAQIDRANRQRRVSIIANVAGMPTGAASQAFFDAFATLDAPPTYRIEPVGRAKNQAESVVAFFIAFGLSLVFMYMILAAQFESFVHPITILLAVPLTIPFALISLILLGQPLTLFSVLGLFLLFGIVKKNGIMQVDYTNVLRARIAADPAACPESVRRAADDAPNARAAARVVRDYAIVEANRVRLRPILMTTLMLVAAMIPIALGEGPGAANRADMAKVIVGGQALSLLLSLVVTPVAYSLFDDLAPLRKKR